MTTQLPQNVSQLDFSTPGTAIPAATPAGAESLDFGTPVKMPPASLTVKATAALVQMLEEKDWAAGLALLSATHVRRDDPDGALWRSFAAKFRAAARKAAAAAPAPAPATAAAPAPAPATAAAPTTTPTNAPTTAPAPQPTAVAAAVPEIVRERMHAARKACSQHYVFKDGFKLDVSEETVAQYGRAVAMFVDTSWHSIGAWTAGEPASDAVKAAAKEFNFGLPNVAGITRARFVRKGSRIIAACMQANESGVIEPVVYEREGNGGWKLHGISADKKITKYHILSMLLSGIKVMFVRNGRAVSPMLKLAEECAAREMWSQSGMDWKKYPGKASLEAAQKPTPTVAPAQQKPATNVIPLDAA